MTDPDTYLLLLDPGSAPPADDADPPVAAVVGSWRAGGFRPNPGYRPSDPDAPADPLDALLRASLPGGPPVELVQVLLRDAAVDLAFGADGRPLTVYSPDRALCLIVATSAPQRDLVPVAGWRRTDLLGLVTELADGVDVLINPYGPAPARLDGDDVRDAWMMDGERLARSRDRLRIHRGGRNR